MAEISTLSAETAYATRTNICYPGVQSQATIAEGVAQARLAAAVGQPLAVTTIGAGSIKVAS